MTFIAKDFDFIVVGSGSAGLAAALAAADAGLSVLVLEKTSKIGGTSAISGAATWIPANHVARAAGIADSVEEAKAYLRATAPPRWIETEGPLLEAFAESAPKALELIEQRTPLRFELLQKADTFLDAPGAKVSGRLLSPRLVSRFRLGSRMLQLRSPKIPQLITFAELMSEEPRYAGFGRQLTMLPKLTYRFIAGLRGMGSALMIGLLQGCMALRCKVLTNARVQELVLDDKNRVTGVVANLGGHPTRITAKRGVLLASGGFEWNDDLVKRHFPGPVDFLASPRGNEGDGLRMAAQVGAALAHLDQANLNSVIPGKYDGHVQGIGWFYHLSPSSFIVGPDARRFANEENPNLGLALDARKEDGSPRNLPAWFITDASFLSRERLALWIARHKPDWTIRAETIGALANKIGMPSAQLDSTVARFNEAIHAGGPDEFGRLDRDVVERSPFIAIPFNRSFISTKGGPRTDARARVLREDGSVIVGLYCAGVAMANPLGSKGISGGTTIGPNVTWGMIAAWDAAHGAATTSN